MRRRRYASRSLKNRIKNAFAEVLNHPAGRPAKKAVITVVGVILTLLGIALIILPGPAFLLIPIGLAVLAIEYPGARKWLRKFQRWMTVSAAKADAYFAKRSAKN